MFMFSCRFETKMRQHAPNPISISFLSRGNPRGGEGREGKGHGEGEGRGGKGEGWGRKGSGVCVIAVGGDRRPWRVECHSSFYLLCLWYYNSSVQRRHCCNKTHRFKVFTAINCHNKFYSECGCKRYQGQRK